MSKHLRYLLRCCLAVGLLSLFAPTGGMASAGTAYQEPVDSLTRLVDAPATPRTFVTPGRDALLVVGQPSLAPVAELAEPELRLAGLRINPRIDGRSRTRYGTSLSLVRLADGSEQVIRGLPSEPRLENLRFSPGGGLVSFTHTAAEHIELWVADLGAGTARRLTDRALHLAAGNAPAWLDDQTLVATFVPRDRGAKPSAARVPSGPVVRESLGVKAQARTYQDLLTSPDDEAQFAHHLSAQLARISLDGGVTDLGAPALYWNVDPSPDGRFVLVEHLHTPFSYLVPAWRFPRRIAVVDRQGEEIAEVADIPLQEAVPIPFGSVPVGVRQPSWRADAPATLLWVEAQDGGDAGREADVRDRLFVHEAPFEGEPRPWADLTLRFRDIMWSHDDLALVSSFWWQTRQGRLERLRPGNLDAAPELIEARSIEDRYGDPGSPVTAAGTYGREVLLHPADRSDVIYRIGEGASPEGNRPFLDRYDLASKEAERLFRSRAPYYERPVTPLKDGTTLLTQRETVEEPPNYRVRAIGSDSSRAVTHFPHPAKELVGLKKELITYEREDGVQLSATLYLPPAYDAEADGPLPMLMWAYPQEFKSAAAAGQVSDSPYRFDRVSWRSPVLWLSQGYAVLDDPKMPIVGEGEVEPNDSFRTQLVASARAAVEAAVERGVADRHRIAIGGHSYGAFMTANLLAHSDLFAAGIARSGAYNRTLTPFGFQAEQRTYWEAPDVYYDMSPFMHADKVDEPILLIHGAADNNSGTFPMQSERFYHALKGHGATTRLVMLPYESHGYRARESILHMMWETHAWLERYVKGADPERAPLVEGVNERRGED